MLSVMNAEKLDTSPGFVARRAQISRLHFCLSITSLPWSEPWLAYKLLLLTLKCWDCQPVLRWTLGHQTVKNVELECNGQSASSAVASTASSKKERGVIYCNIYAFKESYSLELGVMDNLCADVILGLDFLRKHRLTTFVTGGPRKPIRAGDQKVCSVAAANMKPPRIPFLSPKVRPISTPSRRFNAEDSRFITEEINKFV